MGHKSSNSHKTRHVLIYWLPLRKGGINNFQVVCVISFIRYSTWNNWKNWYQGIYKRGKKGKVIPLQARCGPECGRGIALLFHDRGTRRGKWSAARPGRTLSPGKTRYPLYRRIGGPQGRSGWAENLVPTWIRSRTVQSSVAIPTKLPGPHLWKEAWKLNFNQPRNSKIHRTNVRLHGNLKFMQAKI